MSIKYLSDLFQITNSVAEVTDLSIVMDLAIRFIFNIIVILIIVRWLYFSSTRRKDFLFTYILISSIIFLLCFLLKSVLIQVGFALGLFAIFGIIRYRTLTMPIREMTYLFLVIGISIINSLADISTHKYGVLLANFIVIIITLGLEKWWLQGQIQSKTITYEKINLIKPENHQELINDLQLRTGINKITRVEIGEIDLLRDICYLTIYFDIVQTNKNLSCEVKHKIDYNEN